jgi:hypothetical protein
LKEKWNLFIITWLQYKQTCYLLKKGVGVDGDKLLIQYYSFFNITDFIINSNMTFFVSFVDKRAIYRWYNLIRTCAGECDWLFHRQHKLCATFSAIVNINYRLPIKVYYRICTLRHIRIEINHGSQNVFRVLTWIGGY